MRFFVMDSSHIVKEYVKIDNELKDLSLVCSASEFQHITKDVRTVELNDKNGKIWPDFINENGIPLISKKFKNFFDKNNVENLFYKKIILKRKAENEEHEYWLALPPRIDCLNFDDSVIDDLFGTIEHFSIICERTGNYDVFKLEGVTNLEIIVKESLAKKIKEQNFVGVYVLDLK